MKYKIQIIDSAKTEMREIYRYIADDLKSPVAASRRIAKIEEAIEGLKENPTRYPLVRDDYLAPKGYRLIVVKNHLVFFIVREEKKVVLVMHVLYGRRDWVNILVHHKG